VPLFLDEGIFYFCKLQSKLFFLRFANFLNESLFTNVPETFNNPVIFRAFEKEQQRNKTSLANWHIHCRFYK
jgi:hypothetical protein